MGSSTGESILIVVLGIIFILLCVFSVIGVFYGYLQHWSFSRNLIQIIQLESNANPVLKVIVIICRISKYIAIPVIIWGIVYYIYYAKLAIP